MENIVKRIGNIEFHPAKSFTREYVEIVKWYENPYYGHLDEYEQDGYGMYVKKSDRFNHCRVSPGCFIDPESCYTLATIDIKEEPNITSCGLRPFDLKGKDRQDFEEIVRLAYEYTIELWKQQHE